MSECVTHTTDQGQGHLRFHVSCCVWSDYCAAQPLLEDVMAKNLSPTKYVNVLLIKFAKYFLEDTKLITV